jgi:diadenosine tetraphosphate (Ap4A) HIT family hydrolase
MTSSAESVADETGAIGRRSVVMSNLQIPEHLIILRTAHWILNHRVDSALPGCLMLGARAPVNDLAVMHRDALAQLGTLMAQAQQALNAILAPEHLYISRYGHVAGHAFHFHIIPVRGWVRQRFLGDLRYRVLRNLAPPGEAGDEPDGAELTPHIWREFCEDPVPSEISGLPIHDVVEMIKIFMATPACNGM